METVAYYRRSTTMQEHSIELQRYKAFEAAKNHHLIVEKEFIDDAISARKTSIDEREQLSNLIELIKDKKIKNLLVYKRDRLGRNVIQHLKMYRIFREYNVKVIFTADEELPMNYSSNGELYEIFIGCMVQLEGKQIHERIKAKREADFRSGKNPGNLPYGYKRDVSNPEKAIIREEMQLSLIKEMYNLVLEGKTVEQVMTIIKSKNKDRKWTAGHIRELLQNPTYMGIRVLHFETSPPITQEYKVLKIVDKKTWETVYEKVEEGRPKVNKRKKKKLELDYILDGFVNCTKCSMPFIGSYSKAIYKCNKCKSELNKDYLEKLVLEHALEYIKALVKTDFIRLFNRHQIKSKKALEQRLAVLKKRAESLKEDLFCNISEQIQKNLTTENNTHEKIVESYKLLKNKELEIEYITSEIFSLEQLPKKVDSIKEYMLKIDNLQDLINFKSKDVLFDIIKTVNVEEIYIDLVYKYPFSGIKEAHLLGVK
ncbi:recombinase family protein [Litchfieldia alkalitelluris]|uniref:recombinase family protein n=1 Tax=Litchfieldia alkalitelluris TaxID=304268 RepID=UPI00099688AD|nr:recombinase family protein [Litchfieldia alkalitelluris]